ncbi:hypothetical protein [Microseira sp. BLCC-F43]|uniref:hypothetical protein n=1 Tax=Microseira sp. BLCC-F43 TaxID=3153602 RepID=UPI0035B88F97
MELAAKLIDVPYFPGLTPTATQIVGARRPKTLELAAKLIDVPYFYANSNADPIAVFSCGDTAIFCQLGC